MANAHNAHGPSSTCTDAEAYQQVQRYGRALIKVRTKRAEMSVEGSQFYQSLIEDPHPRRISVPSMRRLALFNFDDADDKKVARKLLW